MIRKVILLTVLLQCCSAYAAVGQRTISGKIIEEESGESLPYATVLVEGTAIGTTSNIDGFFSLLKVLDEPVTLLVSYVGYKTKKITIEDSQSKTSIIVQLKQLDAQLDEVVVTADSYKVLKASSGISTSTISTKQLALLPNVGETDIFRSLQLLPGVSGTNESSSGLFVRGGTPDQNLVLLDGMTVYKVDHFFGFFSAFNANAVKDVKLHKGAFPAKYGGRISSVVDMIGKTGSFGKVHGGLSVNLLSTNAFLEVPISKKFSFLFAGRRSYTDIIKSGIYQKIFDGLVKEENPNNINERLGVVVVEPDFYFYDLNSKLSFRPSDKDLITLSFYNGQDFLDESRSLNREISSNQIQNGLIVFKLDDFTNWGNQGLSAKWSRQWGPKLYSNMLLARSEYFSEYDRNGFLDLRLPDLDSVIFSGNFKSLEENSVEDITARLDFEWLINDKVKTEFGTSLTKTKIDYDNVRNDTLVILSRKQNADYGSVYFSGEYKASDKLTLNTGFRFSLYDNEEDLLIEPRANLVYKLTPKIKLKAAFGKHYQFVNRIINENITEGSREFWLLADGDLVDVSSALHYVLGATYEIDDWLFDVESYYKDLSGLSEFSLRFRQGTTDVNVDELFFIGDGIAKGIEFLVQKKHGQYTGWVSYTLGSVRNTFDGINDGKEFPALHDQLHEFKTVHSYEEGRWTFASTFVYGSGKPFTEPEGKYTIELLDGRKSNFTGVGPKNGSRLPAYHRLDLSAHYRVDKGKTKLDFGLSVFNFLGRQNIWYLEYDFTQEPVLITEVNFLGFTPNLSFSITF